MLNTLLGQKQKMSQSFVESTRIPVTVIKAGPCVVTQVKTMDKDGYWAVQLGFGQRRIKNITKPLQGHLKGAIHDNKAPRFLREVRLNEASDLKVGDVVRLADLFKKGDITSVTGISKGKGFAGVVKRHGFAGGPKTHGQSDRERAPGSIGQGTTPGRVLKGKRMAGRMGQETVTIKNLVVVDVDPEKDEIKLSGSVPGIKGGLVIVRKIASGSLEELVEHTQVAVLQVGGEKKEDETPQVETKEEVQK